MIYNNVITSHIPNQNKNFEPYSQKFHSYYEHTSNKVKYYITSKFGEYTRLLGRDFIIEGFEIVNNISEPTKITIIVGPGRAIINDTYVEVKDVYTNVVYPNANSFDPSGFFVLSMRFFNLDALGYNKLKYDLTYFNSNNTSHSEFDIEKNKIILGVFNFQKIGSNITNLTKSNVSNITLDGQDFIVRKTQPTKLDVLIDGGIIGYDPSTIPEHRYSGGDTLLDVINILKDSGGIYQFNIS